jgi:hypothetical protein
MHHLRSAGQQLLHASAAQHCHRMLPCMCCAVVTQCADTACCHAPCAQAKGKIEISEFASAHDEEDILFTVTAEGVGQQQVRDGGLLGQRVPAPCICNMCDAAA